MKNVIAAAALSLVLSDFAYANEQRDEAMMKITPSTLTDADIQAVSPALARFGSDEVRKEFLAPSISGDYVACLGVSEVGAGSDVASIKTTARKDGDDYIINGGKSLLTGLAITARTDVSMAAAAPTSRSISSDNLAPSSSEGGARL